jgi:hypothetical protein
MGGVKRKTFYHIKYDDGDKEDLDAEDYQNAFELNLDSRLHKHAMKAAAAMRLCVYCG